MGFFQHLLNRVHIVCLFPSSYVISFSQNAMCLSVYIQTVFQVFFDHPPIRPFSRWIDKMIFTKWLPRTQTFPCLKLTQKKVQSPGNRQESIKMSHETACSRISFGCLQKQQIPGLYPSPAESETLWVELGIFIFNKQLNIYLISVKQIIKLS